jgi:hypothetical protein
MMKPGSKLRAICVGSILGIAALASGGCATVVGTAVSPITGGVDLTRQFLNDAQTKWLWATPFVFVGGAVSGPFVAFFNGVNHDPTVFRSFNRYWSDFGEIFRPFEMVRKM